MKTYYNVAIHYGTGCGAVAENYRRESRDQAQKLATMAKNFGFRVRVLGPFRSVQLRVH